jgi:hypothetical protein
VAFVLAAQGRLPEALKLVGAEPEGQGRATAYMQVADGLVSVARFDDALAVLRMISADPKEAFPPVASGPGPESTLSEAAQIGLCCTIPASLAYSFKPRLYETIVKALVSAENLTAARALVARMSAMAARSRGLEKTGMLASLALAQADVGNMANALRTIQPVKTDFSLQSSAADKIGDRGQRAFALASLAFEQAAKDPAGAKLNADAAWKVAQEARDQSPSYVFQNAIEFVAVARARMGDIVEALGIIQGPDLQKKSWPIAMLVQRMVEDGYKDTALTLARGQGSIVTRANALLQIATSLIDQLN